MGSCFSSNSTSTCSFYSPSSSSSTSKVIALDGTLEEYSIPVTVFSVISPHHRSCFLCDSDSLDLDTNVCALDANYILQPDQLYFVLPVSKRNHTLSGSEMAALAVKASKALEVCSKECGKQSRVAILFSPFDGAHEANGVGESGGVKKTGKDKCSVRGSRTVARPCSTMRMKTIQEDNE